jgi:glucose-1-phosphate thymidylyltransferase
MKIIIPMAGMGKRLRPQTLTTPKPLLPISGKSIVQRLIEELVKSVNEPVDEIAYIIGEFGSEVETMLKEIAEGLKIKSKIYYQKEALGTAHAIYCASESLEGNVIVAFADTLFKAKFVFDKEKDGIIWVKKVEDPSAFGVVNTDGKGIITAFVEKPEKFVSDLAIIGIYYFRDGKQLNEEIGHIIKNNIKVGKEFQLTTVLENMKGKGVKFNTGEVDLWLDCGNKDATVDTNKEILKLMPEWERKESNCILMDSVVVEPCYIGEKVEIYNSVIGPFVSIESNSVIRNSVIKKSIIQANSKLNGINIANTMIGNYVEILQKSKELNVGDYTKISDQ